MTVEPVTRIKSGRASRLKFRAPEPATPGAKRAMDQKKFEGQRVFSAWAAAAYTFVMMFFGAIMTLTLIFHPKTFIGAMLVATIAMAMLIPGFFIAKIVYERVYGDEV